MNKTNNSAKTKRSAENTAPASAPVRSQPNNPLHGKTLEAIMVYLVSYYNWEELGKRIPINCFLKNPSIKSSLKFLRRTPWARAKVEKLYIETVKK